MGYDVPRTVLALVASVIAGAAAIAVARDTGMAGYDLAAGVFLVEAVVAAALAVGPSPGGWPGRRRGFANLFTSASIVAGLVLVVFTGARAADDPASGSSLPTVLGIASTTWADIATFGVPLLLAIARSDVPDRLRPRTTG
ncbi:MAG TPA: hypothetical protein VGQ85_08810 [Candidatus Limnocylindrales bacterium]|nr:hypothetical protein [Candidatus Limnocylindrales bacterium]